MAHSKPIEVDHEQIADQRQRSRRMLMVELRSHRFGQGRIRVRDISPGGLGGTTSQWLRAGERVEAELPNIGNIAATVAWTQGERFGLKFDDAIDAGRVTRERVPLEIEQFRVMERFRPEITARRPAIGLR
jgi:hypothetical protein